MRVYKLLVFLLWFGGVTVAMPPVPDKAVDMPDGTKITPDDIKDSITRYQPMKDGSLKHNKVLGGRIGKNAKGYPEKFHNKDVPGRHGKKLLSNVDTPQGHSQKVAPIFGNGEKFQHGTDAGKNRVVYDQSNGEFQGLVSHPEGDFSKYEVNYDAHKEEQKKAAAAAEAAELKPAPAPVTNAWGKKLPFISKL
ncbi:unnamed protein product [Clonostachys rosea]|uniref:Uncharacterized protein n=1 Tax=Bionectria ochroleuca TaxID=29856 RepID=A0ABY6UZK7_BIOOC|nr:unnamed protein product [Clonostachys rosea]